MKFISKEDYEQIMTENEKMFGEYEKVKFIVRINGKLNELSGIRAIDNQDEEHFLTKTKDEKMVDFNTEEVLRFEKIGLGNYVQAVQEQENNPASKLQQVIAQRIQQEKENTVKESRAISEALISDLGYFPILKSVTVTDLTVDFYNQDQILVDSILFPLTKGEEYEIYSHEDERDIPISSLLVDVQSAALATGDDMPDHMFAKYYETYNVLQDLEFFVDDDYTKEIFNNYKLDTKFAKVVEDLTKHDLLSLVQEYNNDMAIQQAARELRIQHGLIKPEGKIQKMKI